MVKQINSQYESMLKISVVRLRSLGVKEEKAIELTRNAAEQYYNKGQYRKKTGVGEDIHNVFREVVKPYATNIVDSNQRRCDLIGRDVNGTLKQGEKEELEGLQELVMDFVHHITPLPITELREFYKELKERVQN